MTKGIYIFLLIVLCCLSCRKVAYHAPESLKLLDMEINAVYRDAGGTVFLGIIDPDFNNASRIMTLNSGNWSIYDPSLSPASINIKQFIPTNVPSSDNLFLLTGLSELFLLNSDKEMMIAPMYTDLLLANNQKVYINAIAVDKNNTYWIATSDGIVAYKNGITDWFRAGADSFITHASVTDVAIDNNGILWAASGQDFLKYEGQSWEVINYSGGFIPGSAQDILYYTNLRVDSKGNIWAAYFDGAQSGIIRFDGTMSEVYSSKIYPLPQSIPSTIEIDKADNLWAGYPGGGIVKFEDGSGWKYTFSGKLSSKYVYGLYPDMDGNIWIATKGGLNVIEAGTDQITNLSKTDAAEVEVLR